MTHFPSGKEIFSFAEALDPAMHIKDQDDAEQYKAAYIKYTEKFLSNGINESGLTAEQIVNINLGYFAGYYSDETRRRVEKLFNCSHPVFGSIKDNGSPTAQQAIDAGMNSAL